MTLPWTAVNLPEQSSVQLSMQTAIEGFYFSGNISEYMVEYQKNKELAYKSDLISLLKCRYLQVVSAYFINRPVHSRIQSSMPFKTQFSGYSLFEILIVIAIVSILISIAVPTYENYIDKKNVAEAQKDILALQVAIDQFYVNNNSFPDNLADIDEDGRRDPWGNPYYYTNVTIAKNKGSVRKDKNLTPVNSDYDLYSAGKDGQTSLPFTTKASHDDIVRCNNGKFIGLVSDY